MKKYYIVCDYRERNKNAQVIDGTVIDDCYSYNSLCRIMAAIKELGHDCNYFGGVKELMRAYFANDFDASSIYLNLNDGISSKSKRGQTPLLLELMDVNFSGSSSLTHLAVSDKAFSNRFLDGRIKSLFVPKFVVINTSKNNLPTILDFPVIVKPNNEGSSLGIFDDSVCYNQNDLEKNIKRISKYKEILVQQFVTGIEITNYLILDKNITYFNEPIIISKGTDISMKNMIFTASDKFLHKRTFHDINNFLSPCIVDLVKKTSETIAREFGIVGLGRVDYRLDGDTLYFIEANTNPAFSDTSDIGAICKNKNKKFSEIIELFLKTIS